MNAASNVVRTAALVAMALAVGCAEEPVTPPLDRAHALRAQGDISGAVWAIQEALRDDPDNIELRRLQGLLNLDMEAAPAAESALRRVIDAGVNDDEVLVGYGRALFLQDKHQAVLDHLGRASLRTNHATIDARVLSALSLDRLRDYPANRRAFLELMRDIDRGWLRGQDPVDADAVIARLRHDRLDYPSLAEAFEYRDMLAAIPVGKWTLIHKQRVNDAVFFSRQQHGGSAFDTKRGRLMLFGSDTHGYGDIKGDNWKNNVFYFDAALGEWGWSYPRDFVSGYRVIGGLPVAGENGDHPWAMHTYGALSYDSARDELVVSSAPEHLVPGLHTFLLQRIWPQVQRHPTWAYEIQTNTWRALDAPAVSFFLYATGYDPDRNVVVGYKDTGVYELGGTPRSWRRVFAKGLLGPDNNMVYDLHNKAFVVFGSAGSSDEVAVYRPASGDHRVMPTPGIRPPKDRHAPMAYHTRLGKTVVLIQRRDPNDQSVLSGTSETWLYDLGTDKWEQVESAALKFGVYRNYNLEYDPFHDLLLFVPNAGAHELTTVLALRL